MAGKGSSSRRAEDTTLLKISIDMEGVALGYRDPWMVQPKVLVSLYLPKQHLTAYTAIYTCAKGLCSVHTLHTSISGDIA